MLLVPGNTSEMSSAVDVLTTILKSLLKIAKLLVYGIAGKMQNIRCNKLNVAVYNKFVVGVSTVKESLAIYRGAKGV